MDIVIYDAAYFNQIKNVSNFNDIPEGDFATSGHFRKVRIYRIDGNGTSTRKSKIIFGAVFGSIFGIILMSYLIYVSMRKSFYKRSTTRESAKQALYENALIKSAKKDLKKGK